MKKVLLGIVVLAAMTAGAYSAEADDDAGLQMEAIDNAYSKQTNRHPDYIFGRNPALNNTRCDLWEGGTCTYTFPAAAQQMKVVSTSTSDTSNGTGIRQAHIHYLNGSYQERNETVTLNGTNSVSTVATDILRVNGFHAWTSGTNGAAVGTVSLLNTAGTFTYDVISAGYASARQAVYTVPAKHFFYISHWQASSGAANGSHFTQIGIRATSHKGIYLNNQFLIVDETATLNNGIEINFPTPIRMPPLTDIKMVGISDAVNANAVALGAVMGWLEDSLY